MSAVQTHTYTIEIYGYDLYFGNGTWRNAWTVLEFHSLLARWSNVHLRLIRWDYGVLA